MTTKQIKTKRIVPILCAAALSIGFTACDDGNLNTVIEQESLAEYMAEHPDLRLFMSAIPNYREGIFICAYNQDVLLTPIPAGKFGTTEGIPFGEIVTVEIPGIDALSSTEIMISYTTDGLTPCAEDASLDQASNITWHSLRAEDKRMLSMPQGFLSTAKGGEAWSICGDAGDEPCDSYAGIGYAGVGFNYNTPLEPSMTTLYFFNINSPIADSSAEKTICWDPDGAGEEPSELVGNYPVPYEPPYRGWFDLDPITEGVLHVHDGTVDCATSNLNDAAASVVLPAEATFGPEGSEVSFGPDSSGMLLYVGVAGENVPQEARPRLIPVLNWK